MIKCVGSHSHIVNMGMPERFKGCISEKDFLCYMAMQGCIFQLGDFFIHCDVNARMIRVASDELGIRCADAIGRTGKQKEEYRLQFLEMIIHTPELLFAKAFGFRCVNIKHPERLRIGEYR